MMMFALMSLGIIAAVAAPLTITSPDGHLTLTTGVERGKPYYALSRDGKAVIDKSRLGFALTVGDMASNMKVVRTARDSHDDTWTNDAAGRKPAGTDDGDLPPV